MSGFRGDKIPDAIKDDPFQATVNRIVEEQCKAVDEMYSNAVIDKFCELIKSDSYCREIIAAYLISGRARESEISERFIQCTAEKFDYAIRKVTEEAKGFFKTHGAHIKTVNERMEETENGVTYTAKRFVEGWYTEEEWKEKVKEERPSYLYD